MGSPVCGRGCGAGWERFGGHSLEFVWEKQFRRIAEGQVERRGCDPQVNPGGDRGCTVPIGFVS